MAKRRRGTNTGIPGLSFSAKKALGITNAKRKIAKTTESRQQNPAGKEKSAEWLQADVA